MRKVFLYLAVAGLVLAFPFVSAAKTAQLPVTMEVEDTHEPPDGDGDGGGEPTEPPGEEEPGPSGDDDKEPVYYRVSVAVSGEGSAEADKDRAQAGERVTVTAREADGWKFVRFEGCGEDGTFLMPESDIVVTVFFEKTVPQETPEPGSESPEPPGEDGSGEPGQNPEPDGEPEPGDGEPVQEPDPDLEPDGEPGDGDPGDNPGEPEQPEEPEEPDVPKLEGPGDGENPGGPRAPGSGIRKWLPFAVAGAAVTGAGGGAWYFFIFWKKRKFHGIFAEERIPGTKEWGERNPERWESWFIPELAARLNIGEIAWEDYTDTLLHCGAGTKFPGDTYMTVIPAWGDAIRKKASEKDLFKLLSDLAGEVQVRFTSQRTGMDFVVEYVFPQE